MNYPKLGTEPIDNDHKEILFFLTQIINDKENKLKIINAFMSYTTNHFDNEEEFMRNKKYPFINQHVEQHNIIKNLIIEVFIKSTYKFTEENIEKLRMTILAHVSSYDTQLAEWYAKSMRVMS